MNFLAHGIAFIEDPYFLAGTAVPDWLCVADRPVRVRSRLIERYLAEQTPEPPATGGSLATALQNAQSHLPEECRVALGAEQHLQDDDWFHRQRSFAEVSLELSSLFRAALGPDDNFRAGFLGHIVTEMLLDRVLIELRPSLLDAYYESLAQADPLVIQNAVNQIATRTTARLAPLLPRFLQEQFLRDYTDAGKMVFRLNQVMRRVKLPQLPDSFKEVVRQGYQVVWAAHPNLLPPHVLACLPENLRLNERHHPAGAYSR